jgi:hypothetical protein
MKLTPLSSVLGFSVHLKLRFSHPICSIGDMNELRENDR